MYSPLSQCAKVLVYFEFIDSGNNLSGVAEQLATQLGTTATHCYDGVDISTLAHTRLRNSYTFFRTNSL